MSNQEGSKGVTELATADLRQELKRRDFEQYPTDLDEIAATIKAKAGFYEIKPRKLLEDLGKKFQSKKFISLSDSSNEKAAP